MSDSYRSQPITPNRSKEINSLSDSIINYVSKNGSQNLNNFLATCQKQNLTSAEFEIFISNLTKKQRSYPDLAHVISLFQKNKSSLVIEITPVKNETKRSAQSVDLVELDQKEEIVISMIQNIFQNLSDFGVMESDILKEVQVYIRQNIDLIRNTGDGVIGNKILKIATGLAIANGVQKYYQNRTNNPENSYKKYFRLANKIRYFGQKNSLESEVIGTIYRGESKIENLKLVDFVDIGEQFKQMEKKKIEENLNTHKDIPNSSKNSPEKVELTTKESLFLQNIDGSLQSDFGGLSVQIDPKMIQDAKDYVQKEIVQIRNLDEKSIQYKMLKTAVGFIIWEGMQRYIQNNNPNLPIEQQKNNDLTIAKLCGNLLNFAWKRVVKTSIDNIFELQNVQIKDLYIAGQELAEMKVVNTNKKF